MGKRLLIQYVTASIGFGQGPGFGPGGTSYHLAVFTNNSHGVRSLVAFIGDAPDSAGDFNHSQKIVGYADAGSTVTVHIDSDAVLSSQPNANDPGAVGLQFTAAFSVAGTLIDCTTVTPCAPIVTQ
jgi:hypothetical protein